MKKKILIISSIIIIVLGIVICSYFLLKDKNKYNYSIEEQKWIENNKNNVIDMYIPSDILGLTSTGNGVFFDFIENFSNNTKVKINPVAYQLGNTINGDYSIQIVDSPEDTDIKLLSDDYVLIGKNPGMLTSKGKISNLKLGILTADKDIISTYFGNSNVYVPYDNKEILLASLNNGTINGIVGLKSIYLKDILNSDLHIKYHISDLRKYYVLKANGENEVLNSILRKEYKKFETNKLSKSINDNLRDVYVKEKNISEQDMANLNSKKYTYGYISNGVYDFTKSKKLYGINYSIVKDFALFANIDMKYSTEYSNLESLNTALKNNDIDLYFDNSMYNVDNKNNILPINSKVVVLSKNDSKIVLNNFESLKKYKISVLKNSKLEKLLTDNGIETIVYDSYKEMFKSKNIKKDSLIIIDLSSYEYYKAKELSNFHIAYINEDNISYNFVSGDNELFKQLLDFYLEYIDVNSIISIEYGNEYGYERLNVFLLVTVIVLLFILILQFIGKIKKIIKYFAKKKKNTMSREEKIKYIDSLTSLRNRTYLNDNIEKWDNSEIYPQIIIIVDLNNVSYINDNYGHEEGDKVITEAANILIQTQMPNTEIIRTDGNEFLIYMVDYDQKKANTYIRKLNKEFKSLTHGYGAAIGYSIINDAIKTIDDAVNEATLDMKTNKEIMMKGEK